MEKHEKPITGEEATPVRDMNNEERKKSVLAYLRDLVCWLTTVMLVFLLVFRVVVVSGPSMNTTLTDGDYIILLSNVLYGEPKRGDIIVASKASFKDGEPIIKRVIATEGQQVDINFDLGIVYVDGEALDEPYTLTSTNLWEGTSFPLTVDEGCLFVMGDNRNESKDSRDPDIGLIDCRQVLGKAIFLLMPGKDKQTGKQHFNRIGVIS